MGLDLESPEGLLDYYQSTSRHTGRQHYRNGIEMVLRWQALITGCPTQSDIDAYLDRLAAEEHAGSGWISLCSAFIGWAKSQGFQAEYERANPFTKGREFS